MSGDIPSNSNPQAERDDVAAELLRTIEATMERADELHWVYLKTMQQVEDSRRLLEAIRARKKLD